MIEQAIPSLNVLIADIGLLLGFYLLIHRTILAPEKQRRQELYGRLNSIEREQLLAKGWRESHDRSHSDTTAKIEKLIASVDTLNTTIHDLDKRLALMEVAQR